MIFSLTLKYIYIQFITGKLREFSYYLVLPLNFMAILLTNVSQFVIFSLIVVVLLGRSRRYVNLRAR